MLRLSLIDINNAKQTYQYVFGVSFCIGCCVILPMQVIYPSDKPKTFICMTKHKPLEQMLFCFNASLQWRTR